MKMTAPLRSHLAKSAGVWDGGSGVLLPERASV